MQPPNLIPSTSRSPLTKLSSCDSASPSPTDLSSQESTRNQQFCNEAFKGVNLTQQASSLILGEAKPCFVEKEEEVIIWTEKEVYYPV
jgi:hypothetical protein